MINDYEPTMKILIKTVMRMFYEPHHAVIADLLLENILLSDSEFCEKMKMLNREFNRLIVKLRDDNLLKHDIKVEVKEDGKQNLRTVFFFNYAEFRDIIKYKIYKMTKALEVKMQSSDEAFFCPECDRKFTALDAQANMENFIFKCNFCKNELIEYSSSANENGVEFKELLNTIEPIVNLLKISEEFQIPTLDYFQVLELKREKESVSKSENENIIQKEDIINTPGILKTEADSYFDDSEETTKKIKNEKKDTFIDSEIVYVDGNPKIFSEITEDDKNKMTEDEYLKYFEIFERKN